MTLSNTPEEAAIRRTIARYFDALNHSDVEAVLKLYTNDPVMLPFLQPTVVGTEAVRLNYESTFQHIRFQVQTSIQELVEMSAEWTPVSTQKGSPAAFHELFLLRKSSGGEWLIARYSFSPTTELPVL
jgi:uncharacterized protein (TIGR02246 family)